MSQDAVTQIAERARNDPAFREQLQANPESALAGYELTAEERLPLLGVVQATVDLSDEQLDYVAGGYDQRHTEVARWNFENAWPTK
jgi:hypothetical protein